jgi:hypothetical protein
MNALLNDRELELLDCTPVAIDAKMHGKLWGLGIRQTADLYFEPVVFLPNGRFEFARDVRDATGAAVAVIIPAPDESSDLTDIAAWEPESGRLALLLGRVSMLGQENLYSPRLGSSVLKVLQNRLR